MQLHTLKARTKRITSARVGRGGKRGKTSGKGTKGQNARAGRKKRPELRDFIKRFPKLRGRGVSPFKSTQTKPYVVNLDAIENVYKAGEVVSKQTLIDKKLISPKKDNPTKIKVLGTGKLTKKLIFDGLLVSKTTEAQIQAVGGSIK